MLRTWAYITNGIYVYLFCKKLTGKLLHYSGSVLKLGIDLRASSLTQLSMKYKKLLKGMGIVDQAKVSHDLIIKVDHQSDIFDSVSLKINLYFIISL